MAGRGTRLALEHTAVLLTDTATLIAAWVAWRLRLPGPAVSALVVTLSQDGRPAGPLSAALAGVLEDPTLQVVTKLPGEGWRDDAGQPISAPETLKDATVADVPGGGIFALLHGPGPRADIDVCTAAARAAVLALQRVRITTEMHRQINQDAVRRSAARRRSGGTRGACRSTAVGRQGSAGSGA